MNGSVVPAVAEQYRSRMPATTRVNILMCTNALFLQHPAVCLASSWRTTLDFSLTS